MRTVKGVTVCRSAHAVRTLGFVRRAHALGRLGQLQRTPKASKGQHFEGLWGNVSALGIC